MRKSLVLLVIITIALAAPALAQAPAEQSFLTALDDFLTNFGTGAWEFIIVFGITFASIYLGLNTIDQVSDNDEVKKASAVVAGLLGFAVAIYVRTTDISLLPAISFSNSGYIIVPLFAVLVVASLIKHLSKGKTALNLGWAAAFLLLSGIAAISFGAQRIGGMLFIGALFAGIGSGVKKFFHLEKKAMDEHERGLRRTEDIIEDEDHAIEDIEVTDGHIEEAAEEAAEVAADPESTPAERDRAFEELGGRIDEIENAIEFLAQQLVRESRAVERMGDDHLRRYTDLKGELKDDMRKILKAIKPESAKAKLLAKKDPEAAVPHVKKVREDLKPAFAILDKWKKVDRDEKKVVKTEEATEKKIRIRPLPIFNFPEIKDYHGISRAANIIGKLNRWVDEYLTLALKLQTHYKNERSLRILNDIRKNLSNKKLGLKQKLRQVNVVLIDIQTLLESAELKKKDKYLIYTKLLIKQVEDLIQHLTHIKNKFNLLNNAQIRELTLLIGNLNKIKELHKNMVSAKDIAAATRAKLKEETKLTKELTKIAERLEKESGEAERLEIITKEKLKDIFSEIKSEIEAIDNEKATAYQIMRSLKEIHLEETKEIILKLEQLRSLLVKFIKQVRVFEKSIFAGDPNEYILRLAMANDIEIEQLIEDIVKSEKSVHSKLSMMTGELSTLSGSELKRTKQIIQEAKSIQAIIRKEKKLYLEIKNNLTTVYKTLKKESKVEKRAKSLSSFYGGLLSK